MNKKLSGLIAKRSGDQFQRYFESRCRILKIDCVRIPDGCRQLSAFKTMRVKTPFDYIIAKNGLIAFLDLKSTRDKTLAYSKIERHQLAELARLGRHSRAGYLVFYREFNELVYYGYETLGALKPNESLSLDDGLRIGNVLIGDIGEIFK